MYGHTDYISLKTGSRRVTPRKLFYLMLGVVLGVSLTIICLNKYHSQKHRNDINDYRHEHHMQGHHSHMSDEGTHLERNEASRDKRGDEAHHNNYVGDGKVTFHATNEWQVVPANAVVPAGLDINLDFKTGERMARLRQEKIPHENLPAIQESAQPLEHSHEEPPKQAGQPVQKTVVEERLDQVISTDPVVQNHALEWLDVEAHRLNIGEAITHAHGFKNLLKLLETGEDGPRLEAAGIIAACLHSNAGAVEGALMSPLITKIVQRLPIELNPQAKRRMIAILTYLAQSSLPGTLHQFVAAQGFEALEKISANGLDHSTFEREMVLLATLARDEYDSHNTAALFMLNKYLLDAQAQFDEVSLDAFKPVCLVEAKHVRYANIASFCKHHVTK